MPSVSVVIPVKNGFPEIRDCIEGILRQTVPVKEILVIDSGSTDGTIQYLESISEVRLIKIDPSEFNHGSTRNIGWQQCEADLLLYTVQDAKAVDNHWIEELLKGFVDEEVVAVCGQQVVPHDKDKNPADWFRPVSEPQIIRYQFGSAAKFESIAPERKKNICGWDDVTAMYRRHVLMRIPFRGTPYGEDAIWAKETLLAGYAIVYNYRARVYHYHLENEEFAFKRRFTTMYLRYRQFGFLPVAPVLTFRSKLNMVKTLVEAFRTDIRNIVKWYNYNTGNFRALVQSHQLFMQTLQQGEAALDAKHAELCGKPPIPLKAK
jgi:rhamnosyltransferase